LAALAFAQEQSTNSSSVSASKETVDYSTPPGLGFCGGATSGIGFAFRQHFASRWGVNVGAFGIGGSNRAQYDSSSWVWLNLGAQGMYTIHRHPAGYFRFYALAGGEALISGRNRTETYNPQTGMYATTKQWNFKDNLYLVGAGLGIEFLFAKHIGLAIELPLSVQIRESGFNMWPIPNGALIYFF